MKKSKQTTDKITTKDNGKGVILTQEENERKENEQINEFIYNRDKNTKLTQEEEWMEECLKKIFQDTKSESIPSKLTQEEEWMEGVFKEMLQNIDFNNINVTNTTLKSDASSTQALKNQYVENISNSDEDMDKMINKTFYQEDRDKVKSSGENTSELNEDY